MKKQLIILWIGIGLVVLAILFPPWMRGGGFRGYGFLFNGSYNVIEPSRLTAEILIIVLLTASALYTNHIISEEARKRIKLVIKFLAWGVVVIVLCVVTLICVFRVINWQAKKVQATDPYVALGYVKESPAPKPVLPPPVVYKTIHATIHDATRYGDLADVKRHLKNGVETNARDPAGKTPLMWAASRNVFGCFDDKERKERLDIVELGYPFDSTTPKW